mgnify:CR=1 FL=1
MGQTISVADIVKLAEDVMSEFQSRSTWGRYSAASSAPTSCTVPDQHNWPKLRHYTECLFMRSQRDAWELVMYLTIIVSIFALAIVFQSAKILRGIATKTTKHVVSVVNKLNVANGSNIEQERREGTQHVGRGRGLTNAELDSWI